VTLPPKVNPNQVPQNPPANRAVKAAVVILVAEMEEAAIN
jgi:hypothetical protein